MRINSITCIWHSQLYIEIITQIWNSAWMSCFRCLVLTFNSFNMLIINGMDQSHCSSPIPRSSFPFSPLQDLALWLRSDWPSITFLMVFCPNLIQVWKWCPTLQSSSWWGWKVFSLGGEVQLPQRACRVPPHHLSLPQSADLSARNWASHSGNIMHLYIVTELHCCYILLD